MERRLVDDSKTHSKNPYKQSLVREQLQLDTLAIHKKLTFCFEANPPSETAT